MNASHRQKHWWLWGAIAALLIVGGCIILGRPAAKKAGGSPAIPVSASPVTLGNIDVCLDALGTVTPISTVTVTSRVAGQLTEIHYQEGQIVKKNDLLAVIDPRPYQAALTQAEGQLAKDQALLRNAKLDLARYQEAYRQHAIPEQEVATQLATVEGDEGTVKVDEGNLQAAQVNVDYTRITSPIAGRVGLRLTDLGNIVAANGTTGLVTITQLQPITVIFTIAEDDLSAVVAAMQNVPALRVDALDRTQELVLTQGTLLTLDNAVNPTTGTVRAKAIFPNAKNELFPYQFVNAKLYLKTLTGVDLVATASIQHNTDATQVYVIQPNGTVQLKDVKVTATNGETSAVTGVNAGDVVVTDGFDKLQNGVKVRIRKPAAATGSTSASTSSE